MRTVLPVTVSFLANISISLISALLPDPVGPTTDIVSPGRMVILLKFSR
jgi:hypothetical protein